MLTLHLMSTHLTFNQSIPGLNHTLSSSRVHKLVLLVVYVPLASVTSVWGQRVQILVWPSKQITNTPTWHTHGWIRRLETPRLISMLWHRVFHAAMFPSEASKMSTVLPCAPRLPRLRAAANWPRPVRPAWYGQFLRASIAAARQPSWKFKVKPRGFVGRHSLICLHTSLVFITIYHIHIQW